MLLSMALGCNAIFGLDELDYEGPGGAGGAADAGGAAKGGAMTGGAAGTPTGVSGGSGGSPGTGGQGGKPCTANGVQDGQETDVDCGGGVCPPCGQGKACLATTDCQSSICADDTCCDTACAGSCEACSLADLVGTCSPHAPGTDPDGECDTDSTCDGAGQCKLIDGQPCTSSSACASTFCRDGVCCNATCTELCAGCDIPGHVGFCAYYSSGDEPDSECPSGQTCDGLGVCKLDDGEHCTTNSQCASTHCVDAYCCNTACTATCSSCSGFWTANQHGVCDHVDPHTDPDSECGTNYCCNGNGSCQFYGGPCM